LWSYFVAESEIGSSAVKMIFDHVCDQRHRRMDGRTDRQLAVAILLFALASFSKNDSAFKTFCYYIILAFAT